MIFSTHVTALCGRESKSYIQVVMETTSKLVALTLELWQVESLSLERTGGVWGSLCSGENIMVCGGWVLEGIDAAVCGVRGTCARVWRPCVSFLQPPRQRDDPPGQITKQLSFSQSSNTLIANYNIRKRTKAPLCTFLAKLISEKITSYQNVWWHGAPHMMTHVLNYNGQL